MENKKFNNRNLLYSLLFFVLANIALYFDSDKIREFVFSLPNIKSKLLFSDLFPAFEQIIGSVIILVTIFLLFSLYFGIQFIRKEPDSKKMFGLIPKNLLGFFSIILIIADFVYLKLILVGFLAVL